MSQYLNELITEGNGNKLRSKRLKNIDTIDLARFLVLKRQFWIKNFHPFCMFLNIRVLKVLSYKHLSEIRQISNVL